MAYFSMLFSFLILLLHSHVASSSKTICQVIPRLMVMEPEEIIRSEAGSTEMWNSNSFFQCAGAEVVRYTIQSNGLLLPFYINSDRLYYIIQGKGILGLIIPGCSQESDGGKNIYECQQIQRFQKGDVLAVRTGETIWIYNDGSEPIISIATNPITDAGPRRAFYLAGYQKILNGFSLKLISEVFNVDDELAMKLQNEDLRGRIVYVTGGELHVSSSQTNKPCSRQNQLESISLSNITDESLCNINTRITNISDRSRADLFIPKIGYFKTIDSHQFFILKSIQLSATYHILLKDVMRLPHWENSNSIIYVIKGKGHIQVVDENGKNVFDDVVKVGQLLVVPKSFVIAELAKSKKLEYIIFKTNVNPITSYLSGRNSVMYDLPLKVVTNAYNITDEEGKKMKFNRIETSLARIMPKNI